MGPSSNHPQSEIFQITFVSRCHWQRIPDEYNFDLQGKFKTVFKLESILALREEESYQMQGKAQLPRVFELSALAV